jgi:hypothetical protein
MEENGMEDFTEDDEAPEKGRTLTNACGSIPSHPMGPVSGKRWGIGESAPEYKLNQTSLLLSLEGESLRGKLGGKNNNLEITQYL